MKKVFLLASLMFATFFTAFGQQDPTESLPPTSAPVASDALQAGNWMVGGGLGSIGFNFASNTFSLNLVPHAGYFLTDRVVLGAQTTLGLTAYEGGTQFNFGVSPFLRYFFAEGARDTGRWFGEIGAGLAGSSLPGNIEDDSFSGLLALRAGYTHFIARNVALEGSTGYTFTGADLRSSSTFSGLGVVFGFQIYLPGGANR